MLRRPCPSRCTVMSWPPWKLSQPIEMPGLPGQHRAPAHEVGALLHQALEPRLGLQVVPVAQQDQAVGLVAVLVVGLPVGRQLLERDQQVVALQRAGPGDRTEHRQEERVDLRIVRGRILEEQQRQRPRVLGAQVGGVLVDLVVQLLGDGLDALARFLADHRAATQGTRHRRLGNPGQVRDIQRSRLALDRHGAMVAEIPCAGMAAHGAPHTVSGALRPRHQPRMTYSRKAL